MTRGTTPTLSLKVSSALNLSEMKQIWVTLKNLVHELTFTKDSIRIEENHLLISLTQEQTLEFVEGKINIQVRVLTSEGKAYASNVTSVTVDQILKEGVIE